MADDTNQNILIKLQALDNLTPVMLAALQGMEANSQRMAAALDEVSDSSDKTADSTEGLNGGVVTLAAGMELLEAGLEIAKEGFDVVYEAFAKGIEASEAAEAAQNKLTGALISTGQYSADTSDEFSKFAENLAKTDGVSQDVTKSILASGLQMGLSKDKAEGLVTASEKLAATTGQTVQEAFSTLNQTLAGHARGLQKVLPGVSDLSAAQLRGGAAIDLVNASLNAQLELYQNSYSASVNKASVALEEVYKNLGDVITQNAAVKTVIQEVAVGFNELSDFLAKNKDEISGWVTGGVTVGIDTLEIMNTTMDAAYRVGSASFHGLLATVDGLGAGMLELVSGPMKLVLEGIALLPGETGKAAQGAVTSIDNAISSLKETAAENANATVQAMTQQTAASKAVETGLLGVQGAVDKATASTKQYTQASEDAKNAESARAAAAQLIVKTYDGYSEGTQKQRDALKLEAADRDSALKEFQTYLTNKERVAITAAQEQEMAINAIKAKALGGSAPSGKNADSQVQIDAETKTQAALQVLRQKGIIDEDEYNDALLQSQEKSAQAQLAIALSSDQALADALGNSPSGFAAKEQLTEQHQTLQLAQAKEFAAAQGASELQQNALETQMREQFYSAKLQSEKAFNTQEIALATAHETQLATILGNSPAGFAKKQQVAQQQFNMEQILRKQEGQKEGLTDKQIAQAQIVAQSEFETQSFNQRKAYYEELANLQEVSGQTVTATANAFYMQQEQAQTKSVNSFLSGVSIMKAGQSSLASTFDTIGQAMIKNQKMTSRQMAGAALEAFGTQVMETGAGLMALSIFRPTPRDSRLGRRNSLLEPPSVASVPAWKAVKPIRAWTAFRKTSRARALFYPPANALFNPLPMPT